MEWLSGVDTRSDSERATVFRKSLCWFLSAPCRDKYAYFYERDDGQVHQRRIPCLTQFLARNRLAIMDECLTESRKDFYMNAVENERVTLQVLET